MRVILTALTLAFLCACSVGPQYQLQTLPSGKQVKIINIQKVQMATPNGVIRYMRLDYQTDLSISDIDALRNEADQIWPYFKNNVEQAGLREATIRANSAPTGTIVQKSSSHAFGYKKAANGMWSRAGG
jgi:hypothetical protein